MDEGSYPKLIAVVIIIAVVAMAALYGMSLVSKEMAAEKTATVTVNCESLHVTNTVDSTLEVTGQETQVFTLEPGEIKTFTFTYKWKGSDTMDITAKLTTQGGGITNTDTDSEVQTLKGGETYTIELISMF